MNTLPLNNVAELQHKPYGLSANFSIPQGVVTIEPGETIQDSLDRYQGNTTFLLKAGVHKKQQVKLGRKDVLLGEYGAVLDGEGVTPWAIRGNLKAQVRNIEIRNYASDTDPGLRCFEDMTVENCYIHHNHHANLTVASRAVVRGNKLTHGGRYGMSGAGSIGALVEGNEIAHNNTRQLDEYDAAGGTKFAAGTENLMLRGNYVHDNFGMGLWVDIRGRNITIEENLVAANTAAGILYEISALAIIRRNGVRGNKKFGIQVSNSVDVEVCDNLIEENGTGVSLRASCRGTEVPQALRNVKVYNNTIKQSQTGSRQLGKASSFWVQKDTCPEWSVQAADVYEREGNVFYDNHYTLAAPIMFFHNKRELDLSAWQRLGFH